MKRWLIVGIIVFLLIVAFLAVIFFIKSNDTLGDLMCRKDSDCKYVNYVGECYPPEYIEKRIESCEDGSRPCLEEVPEREGVICSCEEVEQGISICVAKN